MATMLELLLKRLPSPQSPVSIFIVLGICTLGLFAPRLLPVIPVLMGVLWAPFWRTAFQSPQMRALLLSGFAFMIWALASCFWSPDTAFSLEKWGKSFALMVFVFVFLSLCGQLRIKPETFKKTTLMTAAMVMTAMVFLCIEYQYGYGITRFVMGIDDDSIPVSMTSGFLFNRSSVFAILMIVPVSLMIAGTDLPAIKKRIMIALLICPAVVLSFVAESQTAGIALLLIGLSIVYPIHKKAAQMFFIGAVCGLFLTAPLIASPAYHHVQNNPIFEQEDNWLYEASAIHRLEVWNFLTEKITEKPLAGHGLESTRFLRSNTWMAHMNADRVMHPHNIALQLWLEFGIIGTLLFLAFFVLLCRKIFRLAPAPRRAAFAQMVSTLGVMAVAYGLWQAWQIGMISVLAGLILMAAQQHIQTQKQS